MRALLDANLYISYLLSPADASPVTAVVETAFTGAYTLLLTGGVIAELCGKTTAKPYLAAHITREQTERLVGFLGAVAETITELDEPYPEIGEDRKDDYLFAHALVGRADYLVSGDRGVQKVGRLGDVRIVSPAQFLQVLRDAGLLEDAHERSIEP